MRKILSAILLVSFITTAGMASVFKGTITTIGSFSWGTQVGILLDDGVTDYTLTLNGNSPIFKEMVAVLLTAHTTETRTKLHFSGGLVQGAGLTIPLVAQ